MAVATAPADDGGDAAVPVATCPRRWPRRRRRQRGRHARQGVSTALWAAGPRAGRPRAPRDLPPLPRCRSAARGARATSCATHSLVCARLLPICIVSALINQAAATSPNNGRACPTSLPLPPPLARQRNTVRSCITSNATTTGLPTRLTTSGQRHSTGTRAVRHGDYQRRCTRGARCPSPPPPSPPPPTLRLMSEARAVT